MGKDYAVATFDTEGRPEFISEGLLSAEEVARLASETSGARVISAKEARLLKGEAPRAVTHNAVGFTK